MRNIQIAVGITATLTNKTAEAYVYARMCDDDALKAWAYATDDDSIKDAIRAEECAMRAWEAFISG